MVITLIKLSNKQHIVETHTTNITEPLNKNEIIESDVCKLIIFNVRQYTYLADWIDILCENLQKTAYSFKDHLYIY